MHKWRLRRDKSCITPEPVEFHRVRGPLRPVTTHLSICSTDASAAKTKTGPNTHQKATSRPWRTSEFTMHDVAVATVNRERGDERRSRRP